jgi:hypothetical protein
MTQLKPVMAGHALGKILAKKVQFLFTISQNPCSPFEVKPSAYFS